MFFCTRRLVLLELQPHGGTRVWPKHELKQSVRKVLLKIAFSDGWDPSIYVIVFTLHLLHTYSIVQLLFDPPLWAQHQKWFNFTRWINNTWCDPSRSRLTVKHCIYNAIDNIELYWRRSRISTSGSGAGMKCHFFAALHPCNSFFPNREHEEKRTPSKIGGLCLNDLSHSVLGWGGWHRPTPRMESEKKNYTKPGRAGLEDKRLSLLLLDPPNRIIKC